MALNKKQQERYVFHKSFLLIHLKYRHLICFNQLIFSMELNFVDHLQKNLQHFQSFYEEFHHQGDFQTFFRHFLTFSLNYPFFK
jgi:hypothetical protein